jgi:hypothetical protein
VPWRRGVSASNEVLFSVHGFESDPKRDTITRARVDRIRRVSDKAFEFSVAL